jgi:hypothetical protein
MSVKQPFPRAFSRTLWLVVLVQAFSVFVAGAASYKDIEVAVRADDWSQIQSMITADGGVKSDAAALCLMVSSLWNKPALAEKLLATGVSSDASPVFSREAGETALTYAIFGAHENMVAFLLERGAHPNYRGDLRLRNCRAGV